MRAVSLRDRITGDTSTLFYVALGMWLVARLCKSTAIAQDLALLSQALTFSAFALLVVFELTKMDVRRPVSWLSVAPVLLAALLVTPSAVNGQDTVLLQGVVFAICARRCKFETSAKLFMAIIGAVMIVVISSSVLGLIPNNMVYVTGRTRMSLGFVWPSRAPNLLLTIACLYVYLKRDQLRTSALLLLGAAAFALYLLTRSRNPFVFTAALLVLAFALKKSRLLSSPSLATRVIPLAFAVCAVVSVGLCWAYDSSVPWMSDLNALTTRRLHLSHLAFESDSYSLWGTDRFLDADSETEGFLDGSYIQLWFYYGLVAFVAVIAAWTMLLRRATVNCDRYLVVILVCVAFHSVLEGQLIVLEYTPFTLLLFSQDEGARPRRRLAFNRGKRAGTGRGSVDPV